MSLWRRGKFEREMDAELAFHLDAYTDDLIRSGIDPKEARRRARLEFGAVAAAKDECRQAAGLQWLDELRADLRLTLRTFARNPASALIAILSLALGIGASSAIFGLTEAVLLRTLPVRDSARLVFVRTAGESGRDGPPYPFFELLRDRARSFEAVAAFSPSNMELVLDRGREQARGVWVSGNFYPTLGIAPLLGRALDAGDDRTSAAGAAVISRAYWHERFGADPSVIGRALHIFDHSVTIVGVMPSEIMSPEPGRPIDLAIPMAFSDPSKMRDPTALWLDIVARLKPGVTAPAALAESNTLFQAFMTGVALPAEVRRRLFTRIELTPAAKGLSGLRSQFSQPLLAMMILSTLVLLAACVNVANLMLARATARRKEFAVRLAIGAGRGRILRQTLTEALVLTGCGAALGIVLAQVGEAALAAFFDEGRNRIVLDLSLNGRMLLFTLAVAVASGLAFGILPALRAARFDPAAGLRSASRSVSSNRFSLRLGRGLVVAQVALSTVLLAAAGLFIHTLRQLDAVDLGFARQGILTMEVTPERPLNGTPQWSAAQAEILEGVRRLPGVRSAAWATMSPMSGRDRGAVLDVPGFAGRSAGDREIHLAAVSPGYFDTFGVPFLLGRSFTARDDAAAPKVAILNETAARFYFGDANPAGKKVRFANYPDRSLVYEIVGVVGNARHDNLREQPSRFIYLPLGQSVDRVNRLALAVRCAGDPGAFAEPVTRIVRDVRSTLLVNNVATIEQQVRQSLRTERLLTALSAAFGMLALALACIGLFGVLSYAVTRRTSELGIRMALGATARDMRWLVLREALTLAVAGVALGAPAVWMLARVSRALLFGVAAFDIPAFGAALLLLLTSAAAAGFVPARRAARLDPMSALRSE